MVYLIVFIVLFPVKSPVLTQMIQGDFMEAKENRVQMNDMSTDGVKALLSFLYCGDLQKAQASPSLALELLKCADKYDITDLWNAAGAIFLGTLPTWCQVDVALQLFAFANNCAREGNLGLMQKAMKILK